MYLLIDTSTKNGAVGLWSHEGLAHTERWHSPHNHTAELMPAIDRLLAHAEITPAALKGLGVAKGPGGFSALRAGLGVAKGFALALDMPLVGIGTLEASAHAHREGGTSVCALVEAGRNAVAWAIFDGAAAGQTRVTPIDEALAGCVPGTLCVGEGAAAYADVIKRAGLRVASPADEDRLAGLGALAALRLDVGDTDSTEALEPDYARPPTIGTPKAVKGVSQG